MQQDLWQGVSPSRLSEGFPDKLVLLDCETTGGKASYHRITEIGLLTVDDGQISGRWQSLINPGQNLSPYITRLTGITNQMLARAPAFEAIAEELWQYLEGRTLVAHNVRFDLGFLKQEYARLDRRYAPEQLCSVKLSRRLYPQFKRHGLDAIIKRHDLHVSQRHRAYDDAQAIWQFLLKTSSLIEAEDIKSACSVSSKRPALPSMIDAEQVENLPRAPGVYTFYDQQGKPLYIGKSVNLYERIMSHFNQDYRNHKDMKMHTRIAHIETEVTYSDFSAQLLESRLIKAHSPPFNQRLKKTVKLFQLSTHSDKQGYLHIGIDVVESVAAESLGHVGLFRSRRQASKRLEKLADDYQLCHKYVGLESFREDQPAACFRHQLHKCLGACCYKEKPQSYNLRVKEGLQNFSIRSWPWHDAILLEEPSMDNDQPAHYHLINQWRYLGRVMDESDLQDMGYAIAPGQSEPIKTDEMNSGESPGHFDLDTYFILLRFLMGKHKIAGLKVIPLVRHNSGAD